jgi:ABC-type sugar transport system substrate-binding protein
MKTCGLYISTPEQPFDRALASEAGQVASELTRTGFPIRVEVRHARGDETMQMKQLQADLGARTPPDLVVIIPINQDGVYRIVGDILTSHAAVACVLLQQSLPPLLQSRRRSDPRRLFSVAADQTEIGRIQVRQLAALLPGQTGNLLYVQGRENSFGTRHRTNGLIEELRRTPGLRVQGHRVYGDWSPASVRPAVDDWMRLGGKLERIQAAAAQNDEMAIALAAIVREHRLTLPITGVDGLESGRRAVDERTLAATVVQPLGGGHALRVFRDLSTGRPAAEVLPPDGNILEAPASYPPLEKLKPA